MIYPPDSSRGSDRTLKSQEIADLVLNSINYGILAVDRKGMISACNAVARKFLDIDGQLIGNPVASVPQASELLDFIHSNPQHHHERRITFQGRTLCVHSISGSDDETVILLRDATVSDKIRAELKSCKKLNKELEGIIASSHDGILITDGEGNVLKINDALLRITELTREHFLGHKMESLHENGHFHAESIESRARKEQKTVTGIQKIRTGKEVMVTSTPMFDDQGNILRMVTNARDMSEIINLQEQLAQSREVSSRLQTEFNRMLEDDLRANEMITESPTMYRIIEMSRRIAGSEVTVLIQGESGVGKEVLAKLIHVWSKRRGAFIKVNCGAIPQHLLESELFGYNRGAFTGANREGKPGIFELAAEGTLFLDEIEDLPLDLQVKFLQVVQDRAFIRLGGTRVIKLDVRFIAASNRELNKLVAERKFREDLFYRLNVVPITIPPLRQRKEDVPLLVNHFLNRYNAKYGVEKTMAPALLSNFMNYPWPGNIRELKNMIERLVITCSGNIIDVEAMGTKLNISSRNLTDQTVAPEAGHKEEPLSTLKEVVEEAEKNILSGALKKYRNSRQIGRVLGISHTAVLKKLKKYHLAG